jgi:hypothetical protein
MAVSPIEKLSSPAVEVRSQQLTVQLPLDSYSRRKTQKWTLVRVTKTKRELGAT